MRGAYRSIGINRNDFLSVIQMRPGMENDCNVIEWIAFASNAFNVLVPFYADIDETPDYLCNTTGEVSTDNFYWSSRMSAAMADASYRSSVFHIERYKEHVLAKGHEIINRYDALLLEETDALKRKEIRHEANRAVAGMLKKETADTLDKVLFELRIKRIFLINLKQEILPDRRQISDFFPANILNLGSRRQIWWRKLITEQGNSVMGHTRGIKRWQHFTRKHVRSSCVRIRILHHWMICLERQSASGRRNPVRSGMQIRSCRRRVSVKIWQRLSI